MSLSCKNCQSTQFVKNGFVTEKQRYKCKLYVLFYGLGKASFNMLAKLSDHSPSLIYRWIKEAGLALSEPSIAHDIKEIEFDQMWHFLRSKKTKD